MGYILPVTHYQYNTYQNRITEDKRNPHFVEGPFKTVLEKQYQEITKEYERLSRAHQDVQPVNQLEKLSEERLYGRITGKGTYFSKSI